MPRLRSAALFVALTLTLPGTLPSLGQAQVLDRAITMGSTVAPLSDAQMLARIEGADYLLLGERHDNPAHHQLQAWAVEALGKTSPSPPSLIVEMIPLSKARALDRHLSNNP
ncbi:MAG: ChaN family lipoprotein, partial [Rhodospirillaceae bacterium]